MFRSIWLNYWIRRPSIGGLRRVFRFLYQRIRRGFSDDETWGLDYTIGCFVLPRLKRFKELNNGYPGGLTEEKWDSMLDDMIFAMERAKKDDSLWELNKEQCERATRGARYFGEYFFSLWW